MRTLGRFAKYAGIAGGIAFVLAVPLGLIAYALGYFTLKMVFAAAIGSAIGTGLPTGFYAFLD